MQQSTDSLAEQVDFLYFDSFVLSSVGTTTSTTEEPPPRDKKPQRRSNSLLLLSILALAVGQFLLLLVLLVRQEHQIQICLRQAKIRNAFKWPFP
jgi:hypothetical protein